MNFDYDFDPILLKRICYITHKGKKENFHQPLHRHGPRAHEIIFLDYGEILLELDDKQVRLAPGECVLIPGGTRHTFWGKDGIPFNFLNIMFRGKFPLPLANKNIPLSRNDCRLMDKLKHESVQDFPHSCELMACYLTEFIINLIRQMTVSLPGFLPGGSSFRTYQSEVVNRAISVIANEYSTPLNLKELSGAAGVSESHLRALLKKETGKSFGSLLHEQRVAAAKHLLCESNFSLEEIASAVGYRSLSFFFKIFKRQTGMTPKEYASSLGDPDAWI